MVATVRRSQTRPYAHPAQVVSVRESVAARWTGNRQVLARSSDPDVMAKVSLDLGEAMVGSNVEEIPAPTGSPSPAGEPSTIFSRTQSLGLS
jgi:hypothetical protein